LIDPKGNPFEVFVEMINNNVFFNTISTSGIPNHKLSLKIGVSVTVRNWDKK
jgi:hypothetical protein